MDAPGRCRPQAPPGHADDEECTAWGQLLDRSAGAAVPKNRARAPRGPRKHLSLEDIYEFSEPLAHRAPLESCVRSGRCADHRVGRLLPDPADGNSVAVARA